MPPIQSHASSSPAVPRAVVDTMESSVPRLSRFFFPRPLWPSPTVQEAATTTVVARQVVTTSTIPSGYGALNSGPDPGTVVGIVLGSVGAFLLCMYLVYMCMSLGQPVDTESYGTASVVTRRSRAKVRKHRHSRRETVEIRASRPASAVIVEEAVPRVERVVVEERRRSVSRPPPIVPVPPRVVRADDSDDEIVVEEEHSPPPRRHRSKRRSSGGSHSRRESGYRDIDPDRFAGGDASIREVRRSRRVSRDR